MHSTVANEIKGAMIFRGLFGYMSLTHPDREGDCGWFKPVDSQSVPRADTIGGAMISRGLFGYISLTTHPDSDCSWFGRADSQVGSTSVPRADTACR